MSHAADPAPAGVIVPRPVAPLVVRRSTSEKRSLAGEVLMSWRETWESRELVQQLVLRDIRVRYAQAVMGFAWALLMPIMIVLSGTLIRIAMATASGGGIQPAIIGATAVKGIMWAFFAGALATATQSLLANKALFTKLYFPRETLPLSAVLSHVVDTTIAAVALSLAMPFLGLTVSTALLWVPVLAVLMFLITLAAGIFTSCANLFFRDVKYIVQVALTFGIFYTPVFFEPTMLGPTFGPIMMLNPISPLIEGMRIAVIDGHSLMSEIFFTTPKGVTMLAWTPWYLVYSATWAVVGLVCSIRVFRRAAVVFAEYA